MEEWLVKRFMRDHNYKKKQGIIFMKINGNFRKNRQLWSYYYYILRFLEDYNIVVLPNSPHLNIILSKLFFKIMIFLFLVSIK